MNLVVVSKLRDNQWRTAVLQDNTFKDAVVGDDLGEIVRAAIIDVLDASHAEGQEITVEVVVRPLGKTDAPPV